MILNNPFLARKRQLVVEIDRQKTARNLDKVMELETELNALLVKERVLWDEKIAEVTGDIEHVQHEITQVKVKYRFKKDQIQEIIRLKRLVQGQVIEGKMVQEGIIQQLRKMGKEIR